jgi:hypothetical protein
MSKEKSNNGYLDSKGKIIMNEPSNRMVLWIIANDSHAFELNTIMDFAVMAQKNKPDPDSKLTKSISIFMHLLETKMIRQVDYRTHRITTKGQIYRFCTHPLFLPMTAIVAILVAIIAIFASKPIEKYTLIQQQQTIQLNTHLKQIYNDGKKNN